MSRDAFQSSDFAREDCFNFWTPETMCWKKARAFINNVEAWNHIRIGNSLTHTRVSILRSCFFFFFSCEPELSKTSNLGIGSAWEPASCIPVYGVGAPPWHLSKRACGMSDNVFTVNTEGSRLLKMQSRFYAKWWLCSIVFMRTKKTCVCEYRAHAKLCLVHKNRSCAK